MEPIATCRCPSCGVLNAIGQSICLRCLGPLLPVVSAALVEPMTGETCSLYRARTSSAMLLLSSTGLEYTAEGVAFTTSWGNVASIVHSQGEDYLRLYQTPQAIKLQLSSSRVWLSEHTRAIPLTQFGYPTNYDLRTDLGRHAPQLERYLNERG